MQADHSSASPSMTSALARERIERAAPQLIQTASTQLAALQANKLLATAQPAAWTEKLESHLDALAAALSESEPQSFTRHVQSLANDEKALDDLRVALEVLGQAIRESLGEPVWSAVRRVLNPALEWLASSSDTRRLLHVPNEPNRVLNFTQHILDGNRIPAEKLVFDALDQGQTIRDIYLDILQPSLYRVGYLWEVGQVSIPQEHLATAITQSVLSAIYARVELPASLDRHAVVACLRGNFHEIGSRMLADFLQMAGYNARFLGTNTSIDCLLETIQTLRPDVVGLAATTEEQVNPVKQAIERIRADFTSYRPTIMVGGLAFNLVDGLWKVVEADLWRENGGQAVDELVGSSDWA